MTLLTPGWLLLLVTVPIALTLMLPVLVASEAFDL